MPALDTNILVRWLTQDDSAQCAKVGELFASVRSSDDALWVGSTVLLETEWVLRSRYGFDRDAICAAFDLLLDVDDIEWADFRAMARALWLFRQHAGADFGDCLHTALAISAGQAPLLSFDRRAARLEGVSLLRV